jgi:antitoxin VapB
MTTSTVFINNRSQAVRLPADCRFPTEVTKVEVRIHGKERIISPVGQTWDSFFLNGPTVSDDFLQERASQEQSPRDDF